MTDKIIAPYGSWESPVTSELIVADSVSIGDVVLHAMISTGRRCAQRTTRAA